MKRITFEEYRKRKLAAYKKSRVRKKISRKLVDLFVDYCFAHYGNNINSLFYAIYCQSNADLVYTKNPFLDIIDVPKLYPLVMLNYPVWLRE